MRQATAIRQGFRLVQRKTDGRYYAGSGLWTEEVDNGRMFQSAMQALRQCEDLSDISGEDCFCQLSGAGGCGFAVDVAESDRTGWSCAESNKVLDKVFD
jgi:hypothetical protein